MLWIVGVVLVLGGAGLFVAASFQRRKLGVMRGTETSTAADLVSLAQSVAKDIGSGSFAETAEVKGTIRCDNPLVSELAGQDCVYYSMRVTREYEETYWDTDSKGNRTQKHRRGSEPVSQNTRSCPFEVEDSTGRITVDPTGAKVTAEKILDRFEPGDPRSTTLSVGRWQIDLRTLALGSGRRTLGYKYEETAVGIGKPIYVLGEASDAGGKLVVGKPSKKGVPFLLSLKSEEQLTRSAAGASTGLTIGAAVLAASGVLVALLDILGVI